MDNITLYYKTINEKMLQIIDEERENIEKASEIISESLKHEDNLLHVFGTGGHSTMSATEVFFRAGGLAQINPIFFSGVCLENGGRKAVIERVPGIAPMIMDAYTFKKGEVLIIVSQVGINSLTIDAAQYGKDNGLYVIGIESKELCATVPDDCVSRHPSGKNLHDIVDLTLDAKIPYGDSVIEIQDAMQKFGPISNILIFFLLNLLIIKTIEKLIKKGANPPIWKSGNIPGGDEANNIFLDKYTKLVKAL
ncbi:MAG: sugar isomerase domain-containing protein [Anaerolineaceae bacterium]|nr:sugar isomerase domain-containing protein [Anaerolineaceae bacterium]